MFRVRVLRGRGSGLRVPGLGFRVSGLGSRVQGVGFRVCWPLRPRYEAGQWNANGVGGKNVPVNANQKRRSRRSDANIHNNLNLIVNKAGKKNAEKKAEVIFL